MIKKQDLIKHRAQYRSFIFGLLLLSVGFSEFGGGYAGASFRYASNARELSLGSAMVAEPNKGFHQLGNPALTMFTRGEEAGISLLSMSLDRSVQVGSVNMILPPRAAIGFSFYRSATDNIGGRDLMGNPVGTFSVSDKMGMLSFSQYVSDHLSVGLNLKAVFNSLPGKLNAQGIGLDLGFVYILSDDVRFGGKIENLAGNTTWKFDSGGTDTEDFPKVFSLGTSVNVQSIQLKLLLQSDTFFIPGQGNESRLNAGVEYSLRSIPSIKLRAGVHNNKPVIGFGLRIKSPGGTAINADYALDPGIENEGASQVFSLVLNLGLHAL